MVFLKFLIDDMCAKFTVPSMCELVKVRLVEGPCTIDDIAHELIRTDRSLDIVSARTLAQAAVEALVQSGDVAIQGTFIAGNPQAT